MSKPKTLDEVISALAALRDRTGGKVEVKVDAPTKGLTNGQVNSAIPVFDAAAHTLMHVSLWVE